MLKFTSIQSAIWYVQDIYDCDYRGSLDRCDRSDKDFITYAYLDDDYGMAALSKKMSCRSGVPYIIACCLDNGRRVILGFTY